MKIKKYEQKLIAKLKLIVPVSIAERVWVHVSQRNCLEASVKLLQTTCMHKTFSNML